MVEDFGGFLISKYFNGGRRMKTQINSIVLEDSTGYSPTVDGVFYTDISGTRIFVPMKVLIRLYEGAKYDIERKGYDWAAFCASFFEEDAA